MHPTIQDNEHAIDALCRQYEVRRLEVFGSSTQSSFDPSRSDFDFIVDLGPYAPGIARRFVEFSDALELLLGRKIDLVFEERMNPRFREAVAETREVIFASGDSPVAA